MKMAGLERLDWYLYESSWHESERGSFSVRRAESITLYNFQFPPSLVQENHDYSKKQVCSDLELQNLYLQGTQASSSFT
jgi:hypothetical protein